MAKTLPASAYGPLLMWGLILALAPGCGGGGESGPAPPSLQTICQSGTPVSSDKIGLECEAPPARRLQVRVVIGGPSTSSDIYGVRFDLVFDGAVLEFDGASSTSTFLAKGGGQAEILASVSAGDPNRLVVGVSRVGSVGGVQATASEEVVVSLSFIGRGVGTSTVRFENAGAVDSTLAPISSLSFAGQLQVDVE